MERTERSKRFLNKRRAGCHRHRCSVSLSVRLVGLEGRRSILVSCFRFMGAASVMNRLRFDCELRLTSAGLPVTTERISFLTERGEAETHK